MTYSLFFPFFLNSCLFCLCLLSFMQGGFANEANGSQTIPKTIYASQSELLFAIEDEEPDFPLEKSTGTTFQDSSVIAEAEPSLTDPHQEQPIVADALNASESRLATTALGTVQNEPVKTILINFNNVNIIEFIRFISRISNKNFVFDEADLQFNVTIVSEEATTIENIMTALLQELRIHGLILIEQGNNLIIHKNPGISTISKVVTNNELTQGKQEDSEIVTRLFRLNTIDAAKASAVLHPVMSDKSIIEVFADTNYLIVTDFVANVNQVATLLQSLDAPNSGLSIGQYVIRNGSIESLIDLSKQLMLPISQAQPLVFVPHTAARSIFIVSTPFLIEKTFSILQYLDQNQGTTRIFDFNSMKFNEEAAEKANEEAVRKAQNEQASTSGKASSEILGTPGLPGGPGGTGATEGTGAAGGTGARSSLSSSTLSGPAGGWELDAKGNWVFRPKVNENLAGNPIIPPEGNWFIDANGNWHFQAGIAPETRPGAKPPGYTGQKGLSVQGPEGSWKLESQGSWVFQIAPGKSISPERLSRTSQLTEELPVGHIERTQFLIHKLLFRQGEKIQQSLIKIGKTLATTGRANSDLIATIDSAQWLEASNSLIFTGSAVSLAKVKELIEEIDTPLRQVFIEMLILLTTVTDSLNYGVNMATNFGGGVNLSGAGAYNSLGTPLPAAMQTTGPGEIPDASTLANGLGFSLGIIGQALTHNGVQYGSIGGLIRGLHAKTKTNIILNPKIITEDNTPAEVFVGQTIPYQTQAVSNSNGFFVTSSYEYRDIGTTLKITPLIGSNNIITLTISEETSQDASAPGSTTPTTNKITTTTKVHLPNNYFLILSGMIQGTTTRTKNRTPCLGGIPFIGAAFTDTANEDNKQNMMMFIRPQIIDTEQEIQELTKHQQDIFKVKKRNKNSWQYEYEGFLNQIDLIDEPDEDD